MTTPQWETTFAFQQLLDGLRGVEGRFLEGDDAVHDEQSVAEGYRYLLTSLGVALDNHLFADRTRPVFVDVKHPSRRDRRWTGDDTDSYCSFAPIDPERTYRIEGRRGDSAYFALTVYNEPTPGAMSDRIIGTVNDTDLDIADDGTFELLIGPHRPANHTGPFIELSDDAAVAYTFDFQHDPLRGRRVTWHIEAIDPPDPLRRTDEDTARRLRTVLTAVRTTFDIVPLTIARREDRATLGHIGPQIANEFAEPYHIADSTYGWSVRDGCYSFASYDLEPDEALVVVHEPPPCRFWNIIVWNQFMAGHNAADARISINGGTVKPNNDGTVTVVVARTQLEHPNAITTLDHAEGVLAFRWILADRVPDRPLARVMKIEDAPTDVR